MEFQRYWPLVYVVFISILPFIYTTNAQEECVNIQNVARKEVGFFTKGAPAAEEDNGDANSKPEDYVNAHNAARKEVGVEGLTWNETVAEYAQNYANKRIQDCALEHSDCSGGKYGENLAIGGSAKDAVTMWLGEKPDYDISTNECAPSKVCGHYTQLVWKKSTQLGCARVKCANNDMAHFVICNYYPPGNFIGEKPY